MTAVLFASLSFAFWTVTGKTGVTSTITDLKSQIDQKQKSIMLLKEKAEKKQVVVPQTVLTEEQKYQLASARQLIARLLGESTEGRRHEDVSLGPKAFGRAFGVRAHSMSVSSWMPLTSCGGIPNLLGGSAGSMSPIVTKPQPKID